jgi:putative transposase
MPRRRRPSTAGLYFHVLNRAAKRSKIFESEGDYLAFERLLREAAAKIDVAIFAYCLMPNHWHLVASPASDGALSRFMHWLTTTHARRWQLAHGAEGEGAVYQGRFKAIPVAGDRHFLWVCRYVERNALRAGLVDRAETWPWSSLGTRAPWTARWPCPRPANWLEHVNLPQTLQELRDFREAMSRGMPFGTEEWVRQTRERLGMLPQRGRGQPRRHCPQEMTPDPLTFV